MFDLMANEMVFIRDVFTRSDIGEIEEREPDIFRGFFSIEAANHFFTDSKLVTNETYLPYPLQEDPYGYVNGCAWKFRKRCLW